MRSEPYIPSMSAGTDREGVLPLSPSETKASLTLYISASSSCSILSSFYSHKDGKSLYKRVLAHNIPNLSNVGRDRKDYPVTPLTLLVDITQPMFTCSSSQLGQ
jgi:hypothetical protein